MIAVGLKLVQQLLEPFRDRQNSRKAKTAVPSIDRS